MIKNLPWGLLQRIPFLPLGEIGYRTLGRGGAVGAPAHPRVPALTKTAAFIGGNGLNVLPINADCRGGVFAVFAKISPPTRECSPCGISCVGSDAACRVVIKNRRSS